MQGLKITFKTMFLEKILLFPVPCEKKKNKGNMHLQDILSTGYGCTVCVSSIDIVLTLSLMSSVVYSH